MIRNLECGKIDESVEYSMRYSMTCEILGNQPFSSSGELRRRSTIKSSLNGFNTIFLKITFFYVILSVVIFFLNFNSKVEIV